MKTSSPFGPAAPASHAKEIRSPFRFWAVGLLCCLATFASIPWMTRYWDQTTNLVEQLQGRTHEPFALVPSDSSARHLASWNAH